MSCGRIFAPHIHSNNKGCVDELKFAFQMWKENDRSIVGFFPRSHEYQLQLKTWIYTIHPDRYSIMLTKLMILSTEYLYNSFSSALGGYAFTL
ncbi:hypothetical protein L7F22_049094 [Adiantum nelumboides]|nr:hypothetical protein [Adiantum nelumboides]